MKQLFSLLFVFSFLGIACSNQPANKTSPEKIVFRPIHKMDMIEKMFNNDNWIMADGIDTSYYYFSRTTPENTNVYRFRMHKGDSVNTVLSHIGFLKDAVIWKLNDSTILSLAAISDSTAAWNIAGSDGKGVAFMTFDKKDDKHISIALKDKPPVLLTRTLPLSTFLVRSRYDFLHGTKFAFSDTSFNRRRSK